MPRADTAGHGSRLLQIAAAVILIFALRESKEVLVPIALAVLFSFLLTPLVSFAERRGLPRVPSVLAVVVLAFSVLGTLGWVVVVQMGDLSKSLPEMAEAVGNKLHAFEHGDGVFTKFRNAAKEVEAKAGTSQPSSAPATAAATPAAGSGAAPAKGSAPAPTGGAAGDGHVQKVEVVPTQPPIIDQITSEFGSVLGIAATAFVVTVLVIFMLLQKEDLRDRLIRLVSHGHLTVTTQAIDEAGQRVSKYLLMQSIINGSYGLCVGVGLSLIGIPSALLWGLLAALLRFIPYVGPWLGAATPILLSLIAKGTHVNPHWVPWLTIGLFVALELLCSSVLEPWLYGKNTGVSPIAILVAAVFWAWVWGGVGLLLATPLTVVLVVIGKYVPQMEFLSVLLGDEPVFDQPTRYYQRLLANDPEEAGELVEGYLKTMSLEQVYETILIPALGLAEHDFHRGRLDDQRLAYIRTTMKEEVRDLAEYVAPPPAPPPSETRSADASGENGKEAKALAEQVVQPSRIAGAEHVQILCLPARDEADEIAGMMFAQILERSGFKAEAVSVTALASEMVDLVATKKSDLVVVSALPPSAITHARYLCKRLHMKFAELNLVIGLWTSKADLAVAKQRIACNRGDGIVNSFSAGLESVRQLAQPMIVNKQANQPVPEAALR